MVDLLYSKGAACDFGIDEAMLAPMIEIVSTRYLGKGICAVKNWMWWDYEISDEVRQHFIDAGVHPAIVFANYVMWDSRDRWPEGSNVKTTPLVAFEENCLFITRNTVYILIGEGHRKTVDPYVADKVRF